MNHVRSTAAVTAIYNLRSQFICLYFCCRNRGSAYTRISLHASTHSDDDDDDDDDKNTNNSICTMPKAKLQTEALKKLTSWYVQD